MVGCIIASITPMTILCTLVPLYRGLIHSIKSILEGRQFVEIALLRAGSTNLPCIVVEIYSQEYNPYFNLIGHKLESLNQKYT